MYSIYNTLSTEEGVTLEDYIKANLIIDAIVKEMKAKHHLS